MKKIIKYVLSYFLIAVIGWSLFAAYFPQKPQSNTVEGTWGSYGNQSLLDSKATELAETISADVPYMVDEATRRDKIYYSEDKFLVFENTILIDIDESVNLFELSDQMKAKTIIEYCEGTARPFEQFGEIGVPIKFIYVDPNGKLLIDYEVSKKDCVN